MKDHHMFLALLLAAIAAWKGVEANLCYQQPTIDELKVATMRTFEEAYKEINNSLNIRSEVRCRDKCFFASECYDKDLGEFTNIRGCTDEGGLFPLKHCHGVQQCKGILCNEMGPNIVKWDYIGRTTFNDDEMEVEIMEPSHSSHHPHQTGRTSAAKCYVQGTLTKMRGTNATVIANINKELENLTMEECDKCYEATKCSDEDDQLINVRGCYSVDVSILCENVRTCRGSLCNAPKPTSTPVPISGADSTGPGSLLLLFTCLLPFFLFTFPFMAKME